MNVPPIPPTKSQPTFGIYKGSYKTSYGKYTWGVLKGKKIEVYDASKYSQKLIYVSDELTWRWIKSKFTYLYKGVKRIVRSES